MQFSGAPLLGLAVTSHHVAKPVTVSFSQIDYIPLE
jgi:hypothetical protein